MLVKSIVRQCEMAADMTVGKRDVTVLHLSCPQRECVTFNNQQEVKSDLYSHVHHLLWKLVMNTLPLEDVLIKHGLSVLGY